MAPGSPPWGLGLEEGSLPGSEWSHGQEHAAQSTKGLRGASTCAPQSLPGSPEKGPGKEKRHTLICPSLFCSGRPHMAWVTVGIPTVGGVGPGLEGVRGRREGRPHWGHQQSRAL